MTERSRCNRKPSQTYGALAGISRSIPIDCTAVGGATSNLSKRSPRIARDGVRIGRGTSAQRALSPRASGAISGELGPLREPNDTQKCLEGGEDRRKNAVDLEVGGTWIQGNLSHLQRHWNALQKACHLGTALGWAPCSRACGRASAQGGSPSLWSRGARALQVVPSPARRQNSFAGRLSEVSSKKVLLGAANRPRAPSDKEPSLG